MKVYNADISDITGNTTVHRLVKAVLHSEAMEEIEGRNNRISQLHGLHMEVMKEIAGWKAAHDALEAKLSRLNAALEKIARGSDDVVALGDRNISFSGDYAREIARTALQEIGYEEILYK